MNMENDVEKIMMSFKYLYDLSETIFPILNYEVNNIIKSKSLDVNRIEHCLDDILNICFNDNAIILFNKLCDYYDFIDKKSSDEYRQFLYENYIKDYVKLKK